MIVEEMKTRDEDQQYPINEQMYMSPQGSPAPEIESLIHQAKNFKILYQQFKNQMFFSHPYYYLLSSKWFRRWKQFVSYNQSTNAAPPTKFIGRGNLPKINQNIILECPQNISIFNFQLEYLNVRLKQGLQQQKDYIFLSQQVWQLFKKYDHIQIKRFVVSTVQCLKVQLYFQQVNLVPMFSSLLRQIQHQKCSKLQSLRLQLSHYMSIQKCQDLIRYKLKQFVQQNNLLQSYKQFTDGIPIRLFLLPQDTRIPILINQLYTGCKANPTFSYKLFIQAEYMQIEKNINDFDILKKSLILVQMKQSKQNWIFWNHKKPYFGQCSNCKSKQQLKFVCGCKFALYCTKKCKSQDKSHHKSRCPNDCQSDQQQAQMKFDNHSRYGRTGLRNLGNTCFMNSGLQCLSHITQLTNYFLTDTYLKQINKQNKLGTKGQLSTAYAKMLKNLWMGNQSSFSPTILKRAIGKFQNMFLGYNQHDSGQLVSFLLDGLHQDLNRIIHPPYVQSKDYDGRPDFVIAKQAWQNHLKRNKSVIVDLMFGQFKSIVDCPNCQYESIQFDPFLMCTLPLKNDNIKIIQVIFLKQNLNMLKLNISYDLNSNFTMKDLFKNVKTKVGLDPLSQLIAYSSSDSGCEFIQQTQKVEFVRKEKVSYRKLVIRQKFEYQDLQNDVQIALCHVYCSSHYGNQSYRKNITPYNLFFMKKSLTLKQVHLKIYNMYKDLYPVLNYQQQVINVSQKQQPFRLLLIQSWKYNYKCIYCSQKSCDGCSMPFHQNKILNDYVNDQKTKINIQFYWRKNANQIKDKIQEIIEKIDKEEKQNKSNGTTIQDCLKLFQEPQILAQDNAWYCPKCKDFVLAKKQMQIYKAPKILIVCLKRFKRKQYFSQKYNILVDFPMKNFDISEYVVNHNLPEQYLKGQTQQNIKKDSLIYDLIGITNHFGGTGGGHYTAYCIDQRNQKWYDFDDSYVSQLKSPQDAITQSAYMLYYKRRQ